VELGENASVWYGTVMRGDTEKIRIGRNSNIQDCRCCMPTSACRW
jgi:carbonic anhydrase/acetyltransferase-like protein (isoleucine patch superfamily)